MLLLHVPLQALVANKREIVKKKDKATAGIEGGGRSLQEPCAAAGPSSALPPQKPKQQRQQMSVTVKLPSPSVSHHPVVKLP
jgi:hypothetical protein